MTLDSDLMITIQSAMKKILAVREPKFRCIEQKHSLLAIMNLNSEMNGLCILPTNAGKSLLYMIPATLWPETVTIVILPLKSLLLGINIIHLDINNFRHISQMYCSQTTL